MNPAIHTENLSKQYGRINALNNVTLTVSEGAIYALLGANGAGKTTLIKLLMNIFRSSSGHARVLGADSSTLHGAAFEGIGYVSENQELPEWMTVAAMLDYFRPFYPTWDRNLEQQLVAQFDLPLTRRLKHLSRGMRMKAAFASSLAYRPSLLVLDEPFSGLDPLVRDELIEALLDSAPQTTIFLSSHDLAEIESFASHVGYLEQGRLLFSQEISALSDRFREVTITLPDSLLPPANAPRAWLQMEAVDSVIRFVHSEFQSDVTERELAGLFPTARDISCNPMPLRSIFLAIARSGRSAAEPSHESAQTRTHA
jgi:ABC-2 type transport system ATP-binding protein